MAIDNPGRDEDKEPETNMDVNSFPEQMEEDPLLAESFSALPNVQVPSTFLPNVMFRVYEKHHREKVRLVFIMVISLLLLAASGIFFALDISAHQEAASLPDFNAALAVKLEILREFSEGIFTGIAGIFSASWQIIMGTVGVFIGSTSGIALFFIVVGLVVLMYLIKKAVSGVVGR